MGSNRREENKAIRRRRKKAEEVCVQKAGVFPGVKRDSCSSQ